MPSKLVGSGVGERKDKSEKKSSGQKWKRIRGDEIWENTFISIHENTLKT